MSEKINKLLELIEKDSKILVDMAEAHAASVLAVEKSINSNIAALKLICDHLDTFTFLDGTADYYRYRVINSVHMCRLCGKVLGKERYT